MNTLGFMMANSTDRGATWGEFVDVQKTLRNKPTFNASGCMAPTNGHATQLRQSGPHPGRLLFSGQTDSCEWRLAQGESVILKVIIYI